MELSDTQRINLRKLRAVPLCIIAAKREEAELLQKAMGTETHILGHDVAFVENHHDFWMGKVELKDGKYMEYYVTHCTRQGIQTFAVEAAALFSILKPKFAIHAGVCAAIDPKINIKDVVFGETALNYDEGKYEADSEFSMDAMTYGRIGDIPGFLARLSHARYHAGQYVSGAAVRMDADTFVQDRFKHFRTVKALDMEASAFLHTCLQLDILSLGIIKGVSDKADKEKGAKNKEETYKGALENTAAAVKKRIQHRFHSYDPVPDQRQRRKDEPGYVLGRSLIEETKNLISRCATVGDKFDCRQIRGVVAVQPDGHEHHLNTVASTGRQYKLTPILLKDFQDWPKISKTFYYSTKASDANLYLIDFVDTPSVLSSTTDPDLQRQCFWEALGENTIGAIEHHKCRLADLGKYLPSL